MKLQRRVDALEHKVAPATRYRVQLPDRPPLENVGPNDVVFQVRFVRPERSE